MVEEVLLDVTRIPSELTIGKPSNSMSEAERYASREALVQSKYPPERHQGARRQTIRRSLPPSVPLRARNKDVAGNCSSFPYAKASDRIPLMQLQPPRRGGLHETRACTHGVRPLLPRQTRPSEKHSPASRKRFSVAPAIPERFGGCG